MFTVFLTFTDRRDRAAAALEGHKAWLAKGFEDRVFLLTGGLSPNAGGAILAHGVSRAELDARLAEDPFVTEGVVAVEVAEITPARADARLAFLTN